MARKYAGITRGRPFRPGNPGKPPGARHKVTLAAETLLDGEAEALTRKCIELAKEGDTTALRLCLERILPPVRGRRIVLDLPPVDSSADVLKAHAATIKAMGEGQITPDEAATVAGVLEAKRKAIETVEMEKRLATLEQRMEAKS